MISLRNFSVAETTTVPLLHVIVERYLGLVTLVTVRAQLLPALVVREPMRLHVVHETERFAAYIARVRLLSSVHDQMIPQVGPAVQFNFNLS